MKKTLLFLFVQFALLGQVPYIPKLTSEKSTEHFSISFPDGALYFDLRATQNDAGQLTSIRESLLPDMEQREVREVHITYNDAGLPASIVRAPGTSLARTTQYIYDNDCLVREILSDGIIITYDKQSLQSSDGSVHYTIKYDESGCFCKNELTGEVVTETSFPNGKEVLFIDNTLVIPGHAEIIYTENQIIYRDAQGKEHIHTYHANSEEMIDGWGTITYEEGVVRAPGYSESIKFNDEGVPLAHVVNERAQGFILDSRMQLQDEWPVNMLRNCIDAKVDALDQIVEFNGMLCGYDRRGNLLEKRSPDVRVRYAYDALNRLLSVKREGHVISYTYDVFGRRLSKSIDKKLYETYIYHGVNILAIFHPDGALKELRIPGYTTQPDLLRPVAIQTEKGLFATVHDAFGNIAMFYGENAPTVVYRKSRSKEIQTRPIRHKLFGKNLQRLCTSGLPTHAIFAGHYYDPDAGLLYCNARYYDPLLKRYTSVDPLILAGGIHPYAYNLNNPLLAADPTGAFVIEFPLIGENQPTLAESLLDTIVDIGFRCLGGYIVYKGNQRAEKSDSFQEEGIPSDTLIFSDLRGLELLYMGNVGHALAGISHATFDFVVESAFDLERLVAYIGMGDEEIDLDHRRMFMNALEKTQAHRMEKIDNRIRELFGVDETNRIYENFRKGGKLTLEVGTLIAGGCGIAKGGVAATRAARWPSKIHSISNDSILSSFKISASSFEELQRGKNFKPFTSNYYRENLKTLTNTSPSRNIHAHHVFPQKFEELFLQRCVNIHHPQHLTWWEGKAHQWSASGYNAEWQSFFQTNPKATKTQILQEGKRIMNLYNTTTNY